MEVFPSFSLNLPLFYRFPNKSSQSNQSHNWLGKKGWLSLSTFYNHTPLSPLILHASTKTWYRSIKESLFSLNINTFLLLTPYIPFTKSTLSTIWTSTGNRCANTIISLARASRVKWGQPMKCLYLHTPPWNVASRCPNRREGRFRKKNVGNMGVSSKKELIFKENILSLIDRYQVFVDAWKISGDSGVWL